VTGGKGGKGEGTMKNKRHDMPKPKRPSRQILMLSAWSFTLVISSFLFMFVGRWIDERCNTQPAFMLGLFILAIGLCVGRIYTDYLKAREDLDKRRIRYPSQYIVK
jgi:hypothetical protein